MTTKGKERNGGELGVFFKEAIAGRGPREFAGAGSISNLVTIFLFFPGVEYITYPMFWNFEDSYDEGRFWVFSLSLAALFEKGRVVYVWDENLPDYVPPLP